MIHSHVTAHTTAPVHLALTDLVLAIAYPLVAAVIISYQPRNAVGWLLMSSAFMGPYLVCGQYAALSLIPNETVSGAGFATWISIWGFAPYFVVWALVPLHFPDGTVRGRRWRRVRATLVGALVVSVLARMFAPVASDTSARLPNPYALPSGQWLNLVTLVTAILLVGGGSTAGAVSVYSRVRTVTGVERVRLQWLVLGTACLAASAVISVATSGSDASAGLGVGMVLLACCIAIAAVRHHLFDIGTALRRTVVYALVSGLLLFAYAAVIAGAGALSPGQRAAYAGLALVALVAAAARDQIRRAVDRLLFGERHDPMAVLTRVRTRLDVATGPVDALGQLAEALRITLKLPYVAIVPDDPRLATLSAGEPRAGTNVVDDIVAIDRGSRVGVLRVARRHPDEPFSGAESTAFDAVAGQAGGLLAAAALVHDLERSRAALVSAREEERRRIRHDLHDGVAPQLAGLAMKLDNLTDTLPAREAAALDRVRDQLRAAVADLRVVVEDLRPPALDELGLCAAIGQLLEPWAPRARVMPDALPPLPAAAEVAAYRIAAEAVNNAMRHSSCAECVVTVGAEHGWLRLEIADDGAGLSADARTGVGLQSIRERASEVGGRLEIDDRPGGGTIVRARLPIEVA
jgi:signal transduction histidine kinase